MNLEIILLLLIIIILPTVEIRFEVDNVLLNLLQHNQILKKALHLLHLIDILRCTPGVGFGSVGSILSSLCASGGHLLNFLPVYHQFLGDLGSFRYLKLVFLAFNSFFKG